MNFELIVAQSLNGYIGFENKIPWYLPEDLSHFKKITDHSIVIMGRRTFESLPNGPLKNRINIVLTKNPQNKNQTISDINNVFFTNMEQLFSILSLIQKENQKVFVIGGSEIYRLLIKHCRIIHMTIVYYLINGDISFPYSMEEVERNYIKIDESDIMYSKNQNVKYKYITFCKKE
jgi:dihydrofolate reductase